MSSLLVMRSLLTAETFSTSCSITQLKSIPCNLLVGIIARDTTARNGDARSARVRDRVGLEIDGRIRAKARTGRERQLRDSMGNRPGAPVLQGLVDAAAAAAWSRPTW